MGIHQNAKGDLKTSMSCFKVFHFPYSLCFTTNRVGLGFRSSMVRAIEDIDL
jgi:hypothetical protein